MNCEKCGGTNEDAARFCTNCGSELRAHATAPVCPSCQFENPAGSRFCAKCGGEINSTASKYDSWVCNVCGSANPPESPCCKSCGARPSQQRIGDSTDPEQFPPTKPPKHLHSAPEVNRKRSCKKNVSPKRIIRLGSTTLTLLAIAGGLALILIIQSPTRKEPLKPTQLIEAKSNDPALEAKVREIASKFICTCGKCGEQSLDVCSCNTAVEERKLIRNSLQLGQSSDQVMAAVRSAYGWMKTDLAAQRDSSVPVTQSSKKLSVPNGFGSSLAGQSSGHLASATRVATPADRTEIFSRFRCPCGQCGTQELKDCDCGHPRGAREVKAFIDSKIAEAKYTVGGVLSEVELKYGDRKF